MAGPWFAALCIAFGSLGILAPAAATLKTCGVSCPCDDEPNAGAVSHADEHGEGAERVDRGPEEPCEDECPDDCAACGCCPGSSAGAAASWLPSALSAFASSGRVAPAETPGISDVSRVFRPPRAAT